MWNMRIFSYPQSILLFVTFLARVCGFHWQRNERLWWVLYNRDKKESDLFSARLTFIYRKERKKDKIREESHSKGLLPGLYLTCNDFRRCFTNPQGHYVYIPCTIAVEHQLRFALPSRNYTYIFCVCFFMLHKHTVHPAFQKHTVDFLMSLKCNTAAPTYFSLREAAGGS